MLNVKLFSIFFLCFVKIMFFYIIFSISWQKNNCIFHLLYSKFCSRNLVFQKYFRLPFQEIGLIPFSLRRRNFGFNIILDENFPDSKRPKVVFLLEIFHLVAHPDTNKVHLLKALSTWNKTDQIFYNLNALNQQKCRWFICQQPRGF